MEKMIEKAEEELRMLQTQHPHRFQCLKLELQSFISQHSFPSSSSSSSAPTAGSTSMKRKRVSMVESGDKKKKKRRKQKDRVDEVLDKAKACLRKIRLFKSSPS